MNQVLLEDEDRNEPRGLLYDIQGERVKTLYTILAPDISIFCPVFPPCSLLRESVKIQAVAGPPLYIHQIGFF